MYILFKKKKYLSILHCQVSSVVTKPERSLVLQDGRQGTYCHFPKVIGVILLQTFHWNTLIN